MDCHRVAAEQLAEHYLSGRLEEPLQEEFEIHLLECPRCLQLIRALQDLRAALADKA